MTHLSNNIINSINDLSESIYNDNVERGWWDDSLIIKELSATGEFDDKFLCRMQANVIAAKMALMHSELSEALEGMRKDLMDDHLPSRNMVEVEFADAIIRILDTAGYLGLDVGGAISEKLAYNANRSDHKRENREKEGGKKI